MDSLRTVRPSFMHHTFNISSLHRRHIHTLPQSLSSRPTSANPSSPSPPAPPSNDDIEAVIQMATSLRQTPDGRSVPVKDTRTQLFVGNLPYRVRWQDLKDLFRRAGTVLRADVSLGPDNRSRGYGTVLLATAEDAGRAIDMFNGYSWQTRILEVRPDRLPPDLDTAALVNSTTSPLHQLPLPASSSSSLTSPLPSAAHAHVTSPSRSFRSLSDDFDFNSFHPPESLSAPSSSCRNLFVSNLPFHCQWQDLKDLFRQAGTILRADVVLGPDGRSRGFGTVSFASEQDAEHAVNMFNGYEYNGRVLKVHFDRYSYLSHSSASPTHAMFQQSPSQISNVNQPSFLTTMTSRPTHISIPSGYHPEYFSSGASSPYDLYQSMFTQPARPQPAHLQSHPQASQHDLISSLHSEDTPLSQHELESLTGSLAATSLSDDLDPSSPPTTTLNHWSQISDALSDSTASARGGVHLPLSQSELQLQRSATSSSGATASTTSSGASHGQHPHHPGPISLPPPTLPFPLPPHSLSPIHHHPMGVPLSPVQHPNMGSPLHHPVSYQNSRPQIVPMTPHGLPPITPSMPPFIFHPVPPSPNSAQTPAAHMPMYTNPSFSPTVAMSPGTFWGRPGASHPNPFINPTVGAPVHMHSPGAIAGENVHVGGSAYFYPPPGVNRLEPSGYFDPAYFPPGSQQSGIRPSGLSNEILNNITEEQAEELQQEKDMMMTEAEDSMQKEEKVTPSTDDSVSSDLIGRSMSLESASGTSVSNTTQYTSEESGDEHGWEGQEGGKVSNGGTDIHGDEKKVISRTHSLSGRQKPSFLMNHHKPDSDPALSTSFTSASEGGEGGNASSTYLPLTEKTD